MWNTLNGKCRCTFRHAKYTAVSCVKFHGNTIVSSCIKGVIKVWCYKSRKLRKVTVNVQLCNLQMYFMFLRFFWNTRLLSPVCLWMTTSLSVGLKIAMLCLGQKKQTTKMLLDISGIQCTSIFSLQIFFTNNKYF